MPEPKVLVSAQLLIGGPEGLRTAIKLSEGVDSRTLLMLAHDLMVAAQQKGHLTPAVAQATPLIRNQLLAWNLSQTPYLPTIVADPNSGSSIAV